MRNILFVMWKELLELRQNPRLFPVLFVAPLIQLTVLGYAATTDVRNVPVLVVDSDRSAESRGLIRSFDASANFTIVDVVSSIEEIDSYLEERRAWMALTIPAGLWTPRARGQAGGRTGYRRRQRRQFHERRARVHDESGERLFPVC